MFDISLKDSALVCLGCLTSRMPDGIIEIPVKELEDLRSNANYLGVKIQYEDDKIVISQMLPSDLKFIKKPPDEKGE